MKTRELHLDDIHQDLMAKDARDVLDIALTHAGELDIMEFAEWLARRETGAVALVMLKKWCIDQLPADYFDNEVQRRREE